MVKDFEFYYYENWPRTKKAKKSPPSMRLLPSNKRVGGRRRNRQIRGRRTEPRKRALHLDSLEKVKTIEGSHGYSNNNAVAFRRSQSSFQKSNNNNNSSDNRTWQNSPGCDPSPFYSSIENKWIIVMQRRAMQFVYLIIVVHLFAMRDWLLK